MKYLAYRPLIIFATAALFSAHLYAAPVANNDARSVPMNTPISIDLLANDTDSDGITIVLYEFSQPANGTVTQSGSGVHYTPNTGFTGVDQFTYTIANYQEQISAEATVTITVTEDVFGSLARAGNDRGVATALDAACAGLLSQNSSQLGAGAQRLQARCQGLSDLSATDPDAAARIMNQIAPEETIALMRTGSQGAQGHSQAVNQRLSQVGQGISSISINGLSLSSTPVGGAAGDLMPAFGFFASAQLEDADKKTTEWENGFDYNAHGITLGVDYALNHQWLVGSAFGWTQNDLSFTGDDGEVETTTTSLIAFASYNVPLGTLDFQLGYNQSDFDIGRNIHYETPAETVQTLTQGSTSGNQLFASTRWQFAWNRNALSIFPHLALEHIEGHIDRYEETNAEGFETILNKQIIRQTTLEAGLQAQYALNQNWGVAVPFVEVRGRSDLESSNGDITGEFAFSPVESESFFLAAEKGQSTFFNVAIGSSFMLPHGISGFVRYEEMLGYSNLKARRYSLGVRAEF